MTTGKPIKTITLFAIPVILGNLLQNAYNIADTVIVGRTIGVKALAAVGATGSVFSFFVMLINGLMSGFSIVAGTKYGARDYEGLKKVYTNGLLLTILVSVVFTVSGTVFVRQLLQFMNTPPDILDDACSYLFIIFCGITTTMLYNFYSEMLRALGNSKRPFVYLMVACFINIVLDFLLILKFKAGVAGAAIATVVSQAVAAVMCTVYCFRSVSYFKIKLSELRFDFKTVKACLRIGIPTALLNAVIMLGIIILQMVTNTIGTTFVAAYSAASKVINILMVPLFSLVTAMNVFVSQNYGSGDLHRAKSGIRSTIALMFAINTVVIVLSALCSGFILELMVGDDAQVIALGKKYIDINTIAMYMLIPLIAYKGALQAFGRPLFPTISGFLEVGTRLFVAVWFTNKFGFTGVILTDPVTWCVTCIFFVITYAYEIKKINRINAGL